MASTNFQITANQPNGGQPQPPSWHIASWLAPVIIALVVLVLTFVAVLAGLEMAALFTCALILAGLLILLAWIARLGAWLKWTITAAIVVACAIVEICVVKYDRPILPPSIEAIAFVDNGTANLGLDMEVLIKNYGLSSGYADEWEMNISIDGKSIESRQLFGKPLPTSVVNEPELDGEEFPPGKPVRGWLFFEFTSLAYGSAKTYFSCGSQQIEKVKFTLSVWDSKRRKKWSQTKSLAELGPSACIPLPLNSPQAEPAYPKESLHPPQATSQKPVVTQSPQKVVVTPPSQTVNAPNGIGAIGSTVINPQVYNYGYMPKTLSDTQARVLVGMMRPLADGSDRGDLITSQMGDTNSLEVALQLVKVFRAAGWNLPGSGYNMALMTNPPGPLLIAVHSAASGLNGKVDGASLPPGVAELGKALQDAGMSVAISVDATIPEGKFRIIVGTKP